MKKSWLLSWKWEENIWTFNGLFCSLRSNLVKRTSFKIEVWKNMNMYLEKRESMILKKFYPAPNPTCCSMGFFWFPLSFNFGAVVQKERQRKALNKKAEQKLSTKTIILIPIYLAPIFLILSKISIVNGMQSAIRD